MTVWGRRRLGRLATGVIGLLAVGVARGGRDRGREWVSSEEGLDVSPGTSQRGSGPVVTDTVELEPAAGDDLLVCEANGWPYPDAPID